MRHQRGPRTTDQLFNRQRSETELHEPGPTVVPEGIANTESRERAEEAAAMQLDLFVVLLAVALTATRLAVS